MSKGKPSPIRANSVDEYAREVRKREVAKAVVDDLHRHIGGLKICLDAEEWGNAADHADCVAAALRKLHAHEAAP